MKKFSRFLSVLLAAVLFLQCMGCGKTAENGGDFERPLDDATLEKSVEGVETELENLAEKAEYKEAAPEERARQILEVLNVMSENDPYSGEAYVDENTIYYDEELNQISFEDAEGTFCFCSLVDEEEREQEYVGSSGSMQDSLDIMDESNRKIINADFADKLAAAEKTNSKDIKILFVTAFYDEEADSISLMEGTKESINGNGIKADITVMPAKLDKMRTDLSKKKYSFISILCHGMRTRVNGEQTCTIRVQGTAKSYKNDSKLKADKKAKRVIKELLIDKLYLTGSFFSYYYGNNKLDGSIIHLSSCSGMGYFSYSTGKGKDFFDLSNGLLDTGAEAVVGHINDVLLWYDMNELYTEITALSCGYNIYDSLLYAYHYWGTTDYQFYCNYIDPSGGEYDPHNTGETATTELRGNRKAAFLGEKESEFNGGKEETPEDVVDSVYLTIGGSDGVEFEGDGVVVEFTDYPAGYSMVYTEDGFEFEDENGAPVLNVSYYAGNTEIEIKVLKPVGNFSIIADSGPDNAITQLELNVLVQKADGNVEVVDLNNDHIHRGQTGVWYYSIARLENGKYIEYTE